MYLNSNFNFLLRISTSIFYLVWFLLEKTNQTEFLFFFNLESKSNQNRFKPTISVRLIKEKIGKTDIIKLCFM